MTVDGEMKLPAVREPGSLAVYEDSPGSELMGFLTFLRGELLKAVDILREETQEGLADGDAADRIMVVNRLRSRKNRLEAHLLKEVREVRELTRSLHGQADKSVVETLNRQSKDVMDDVGEALKHLIQEFGVE